MTKTLEIYNNGVRVMIEDGVVPVQFVFRNERNEITGHCIISIERLGKIMAENKDEFSWYNCLFERQAEVRANF